MGTSPKRARTDFLFANTDILIGVGSVFNVAGNYFLFNESPNGAVADKRALGSDWKVVGDDILNALVSFDEQSQ